MVWLFAFEVWQFEQSAREDIYEAGYAPLVMLLKCGAPLIANSTVPLRWLELLPAPAPWQDAQAVDEVCVPGWPERAIVKALGG